MTMLFLGLVLCFLISQSFVLSNGPIGENLDSNDSLEVEYIEVEGEPTFPLVSDPFLRTKPMEITKSDVCNNESIRRIITESMVESASKSKRRISAALQRLHPSATFAVICAMCPFSYISHTTDFCLHATHNVTCYVFRDGKL